MKPWMKWSAVALVVALLAAGTLRTLSARKARQAALDAQQTAQQTQVRVVLSASDLVQAKTLPLTQTVPVAGSVRAVHTAFVKARVAGELMGLRVREGDAVQAGQVLAHVDPTDSEARLRQARQQASAAKAQLDIAQRTHDNNQALVAQGFISNTALASSLANLNAVQANVAAAESGADVVNKVLSDTVLRSPITGQVSQRLVQPGERLAIDTRVLEIVDNRTLELDVSLNVAEALQVQLGQKATLTLDGLDRPVEGKVVRINPSASAGSRAVVVYLALQAHPALRHGMFLQGALGTGQINARVLPISAVRTDKPQPYIQVVQTNQVAHLNVTLGPRGTVSGVPMVAVTGVDEGAVVIDGSVGPLRAGSMVSTQAAGAH